MPRLLVNSVEGAKLIPFAKGKLRALRAAGHTNITQRYDVQGQRVRVTINGAEEIIEITGSVWDYLVWPTSTAHPAGVTVKDGAEVPAVASMSLTASEKGLRRHEHSKLLSAPHDWVSKDRKTVLSYDHGHGFRYALNGAYEVYTGARGVYRKGVKIQTEFGVKGAAVFQGTRSDGSSVRRVVYAAYFFDDIGAIELRLFYLDEANRDEAGAPTNVEIARWTAPANTVIAQPTFFDGLGQKAITVLETYAEDSSVISFMRPRYVVRCTLSLNPAGEIVAAFSTAPLAETPDEPTQTQNEQLFGSGGSSYFYGNPKTLSGYTTYGYTALGYPYVATTGYEELGYSRTTTRSKQVRFIGLDLDVDGDELLFERVTKTRAQSYSEEAATFASSSSGTDYTHPDGYNVVAISESYTYHQTRRLGGDDSVEVSFTVNGTVLFTTETSASTSGTLVTRDRAYSGSWVPGVVPRPPDPPTTVDTSTYNTVQRRALSLRDADARNEALALVVGEYPTPFNGTDLRPLKVVLHARCHGQQFSKTVFDGAVYTAPNGVGTDMFVYRAIASRRPDEYVICFSPDDVPHADPLPEDPDALKFFNHLALTGAVDRNPLFALRRKDEVISPAPDKFSLDAEPGFRLDPIHVL
ncbi:hypothetical protein DBR23_17655 [Acidovorax sp. HMWF018]|uniref:hypothetical protein n=1 Tax=Acidovorax sp. HMWF018 TaxID=2056855 RepID=UPI000D3665E6|nr:hypothetical protein [Acidovorax sp. HMWF018]PTT37390.1 hypothetical protein DBR23_17655 [Acidovorax sp. HMWF018]